MKTEVLKRTLLRAYRYGALRQAEERRRGEARNYRSPKGRELLATNRAYLSLHPEWRSKRP